MTKEDSSQSDRLRKALEHARERVVQGRKTIDTLTSLQAYSKVLRSSEPISCAMLRTKVLEARAELSQLLEEMARLNAITDSLHASGLGLRAYEPTQQAVRKLLSILDTPTDAATIAQTLVSYRATYAADLNKVDELREQAAVLMNQITDKFKEIGLLLPPNPSSTLAVTLIERASKQVEDVLLSIRKKCE